MVRVGLLSGEVSARTGLRGRLCKQKGGPSRGRLTFSELPVLCFYLARWVYVVGLEPRLQLSPAKAPTARSSEAKDRLWSPLSGLRRIDLGWPGVFMQLLYQKGCGGVNASNQRALPLFRCCASPNLVGWEGLRPNCMSSKKAACLLSFRWPE